LALADSANPHHGSRMAILARLPRNYLMLGAPELMAACRSLCRTELRGGPGTFEFRSQPAGTG
jgi:hypothetical protein